MDKRSKKAFNDLRATLPVDQLEAYDAALADFEKRLEAEAAEWMAALRRHLERTGEICLPNPSWANQAAVWVNPAEPKPSGRRKRKLRLS